MTVTGKQLKDAVFSSELFEAFEVINSLKNKYTITYYGPRSYAVSIPVATDEVFFAGDYLPLVLLRAVVEYVHWENGPSNYRKVCKKCLGLEVSRDKFFRLGFNAMSLLARKLIEWRN